MTPLFLALAIGLVARDIRLEATPEYLRTDPFGAIVPPDRGAGGLLNALKLEGARGGHVSFHLVVKMSQPGPYGDIVALVEAVTQTPVDPHGNVK